jgi:hypothetical protein
VPHGIAGHGRLSVTRQRAKLDRHTVVGVAGEEEITPAAGDR